MRLFLSLAVGAAFSFGCAAAQPELPCQPIEGGQVLLFGLALDGPYAFDVFEDGRVTVNGMEVIPAPPAQEKSSPQISSTEDTIVREIRAIEGSGVAKIAERNAISAFLGSHPRVASHRMTDSEYLVTLDDGTQFLVLPRADLGASKLDPAIRARASVEVWERHIANGGLVAFRRNGLTFVPRCHSLVVSQAVRGEVALESCPEDYRRVVLQILEDLQPEVVK